MLEKSHQVSSQTVGGKKIFFYTGCKWKIEIAKILKVLQQRKNLSEKSDIEWWHLVQAFQNSSVRALEICATLFLLIL